MAKCVLHPGRNALATVYGKQYCPQCNAGIGAARGRVDRHVQPRDCFVWYQSNDNWQQITGTGCAHWVAHNQRLTKTAGADTCLAGCIYRVSTLISGLATVLVGQVQVGDLYVALAQDHVGLVSRIAPATVGADGGTADAGAAAPQPQIFIQHDSSRQGGVFENEFATYFHGHGTFRRMTR